MTGRRRGRVFGEVAQAYDEARAEYPAALVDVVLDFAGGRPASVVEVGAGTGKATAAFAGRGLAVRCVEPDVQMAAVLRARFADRPGIVVDLCPFEEWTAPAGGVDLLYCAQAWHWVDARRRWCRAYDVLRPGGALAVFGHSYRLVDAALERDLDAVYATHAPELREDPAARVADVADVWFAAEMRGFGRFVDLRAEGFHTVVPYPTRRYVALLGTFSGHRMLEPGRRAALFGAVAAVADAHGGVVRTDLATVLALGRRPAR
jgi:SAM-dependent methyltransferase